MSKNLSFLLDQGLPWTAAALLKKEGYDTCHAREAGLSNATDREIIEYARKHKRVVVTLDADFHALLAISGSVHPSIIRLRIEGLKGDGVAKVIFSVLEKVSVDLEQGALVTVSPHIIRTRRLPVAPKKSAD